MKARVHLSAVKREYQQLEWTEPTLPLALQRHQSDVSKAQQNKGSKEITYAVMLVGVILILSWVIG